MFFVTIYRIIKTSLISLWRNRWLSLAATLIMVLTLFTISFFSSLLIATNKSEQMLKDKVDISVYFDEAATKDQIFEVQNALLSRAEIKSVDYTSKEEALERWKARNKDNEKIRDLLSGTFNPLPRSLEIKTEKPEDLEKVSNYLENSEYKPLIKEISYRKNMDLINRLVKITSFIKKIGWTLSSIFIFISVLIIYNTIRLTISARSNEIEIMKLVGASDWYVQGPFLIEGISYGILASFVSSVILFSALRLSMPSITFYLSASVDDIFSNISFVSIIIIQLIVGLILGLLCSSLVVRKHLK